jgi:hypothetical protein
MPAMEAVNGEARQRNVELIAAPTKRAIDRFADGSDATNAILHVTC